jgi:hypothetical protein
MAESAHVIIIAELKEADGDAIRIQNFDKDGISFIPLFSSKNAFDVLTEGTDFSDKGISIDLEMLLGMMKGDEKLILNPGSTRAWVLTSQQNTDQ